MKKAVAVFSLFLLVIGLAAGADAGTAREDGGKKIDCSKGPIPAGSVEVSINGATFKPAVVKLRKGGGMSVDNVKLDSYHLEFKSEDDIFARLSAEVTFIIKKGKQPDGKTFRELPDTDIGKQPAAAEGLPEIQGWNLKDRDSGLDIASMFNHQASIRIELGKRSGKTITGKINLCVPPGPDAGDKMSTVSGTFQADIE